MNTKAKLFNFTYEKVAVVSREAQIAALEQGLDLMCTILGIEGSADTGVVAMDLVDEVFAQDEMGIAIQNAVEDGRVTVGACGAEDAS